MSNLTKKEEQYLEEMYHKFPKPIRFNNVIQTNMGLLEFYNSKNDKGNPFYLYMSKQRMASILYQIINSNHEKDDVKKKAESMFKKINTGSVC
jgi:hypothetical protein